MQIITVLKTTQRCRNIQWKMLKKIKNPSRKIHKKTTLKNKMVFDRGVERIRTAVDGFADHCLATRPQRH